MGGVESAMKVPQNPEVWSVWILAILACIAAWIFIFKLVS